MGRYMAKNENLEPPREGLIRQEIISYEQDQKGMITIEEQSDIIMKMVWIL